MNEQDNIRLVQKMYEAFGRGDVQTILDQVAPNVEWTLEGPPKIPFAGRRVGPDQVLQFFQALGSTLTNPKLTTDEFIAEDEKVVAIGRFSAQVKATGKKIDGPVIHVFTIHDGKVTRFLDFGDTAQMADAYTAASAATR